MDELVKPDNKILDYLTRYVPPVRQGRGETSWAGLGFCLVTC